MANMFGAKESKSIIYKASEATVTIDSAGDAVFLQVDITISRQLTPIATLGQGIQWAAQPPNGQLTAQTIVTNSKSFVNTLTDGTKCDKLSCTVDLKDAVCGEDAKSTAQKLKIKDGYCSQIGFSMSGQQGYIGSGLTIMFTSAELS